MADLLVRNLSPEVLAALDAGASQLGLSRNEFVRRRLSQELNQSRQTVTEAHLRGLLELLPDLADPEIMDAAWR